MAEFYLQIKWIHIIAVLASGVLFVLRGLSMLAGSKLGMAAPVRYLSYSIDTLLLAAALMLVAILPGAVFANGWLASKLGLLAAYIVLGSYALKRGRTRAIRSICFVGAVVIYGFMLSVARTHHPLGFLHWVLD